MSFSGNDLGSGGVAYAAHIAGFISGVILISLLKKKKLNARKLTKGSIPSSK